MKFCANNGSMVSQAYWLPKEPFDYDWGRIHPHIGCNHVVCGNCGEQVKTTDVEGRTLRVYECACARHMENAFTLLSGTPGDLAATFGHDWACAGHPDFQPPTILDAVAVPASDDYGEVARTGFSAPPFVPPDSEGPGIWVIRLYWLLPERFQRALARSIAKLLRDDDVRVVAGALNFYLSQPDAPGAEGLASLARDRAKRFADIPDPNDPRVNLEYRLLQALKYRVPMRDERGERVDRDALEVLRAALLDGKNPDHLIYTLANQDREWVARHAAEIVEQSRPLLEHMVYVLRKLDVGRVVSALSEVASIDAEMPRRVREEVAKVYKGGDLELLLRRLPPD